MFTLKPFKASDAKLIEARSFEHDIMAGLGEVDFGPLFEKHPSWTGWIGDKPAFAAGMYLKWRGSGEVWALTSRLVERYPVSFHTSVVRMLEETVQKWGLWRVEAVIQEEHAVSRKWAERLGFEEESVSRLFGPRGETFMRYVKFYAKPIEVIECRF